MSVTDVPSRNLAPDGAPCSQCGAPLASDQRYCLACGVRRPEAAPVTARLAPAGPAGARGAVVVAAPARGTSDRVLALGAVGCLLVAMLIGVLLGRTGSGDDRRPVAVAPAAQVVTVAAPAATAATPAAATDGPADTPAAAKATKKPAREATSADSKATSEDVKALETTNTEEFTKKSQKLPKVVGTGGKPPPKDNKPAAGGESFEEFE